MAAQYPVTPLTNDPEFAAAVHERNRAYYPDVIEDEMDFAPPKMPMMIDVYQRLAKASAVYPWEHSIIYPALGLAEEAGEVAGKIKRWLRGDHDLNSQQVINELGDVLWYVAAIASDLGVTLEEVAMTNLKKLSARKDNDTIKGTGDDR